MREPADYAYFKTIHDDGGAAIAHGYRWWGEKMGLPEITREEADEIAQGRRARFSVVPKEVVEAPAMPADVRAEMKARLNEFETRVQDTLAERMAANPASDNRLDNIEQTVGSLVDAAHSMVDSMNAKFDDIAGKLAASEAWMLVIEAQSDPSPTVERHSQAAALLGMTSAQDGNAEAWGLAIKTAKEARR